MATHLNGVGDPPAGRDPQFGKRCSRRFNLKLLISPMIITCNLLWQDYLDEDDDNDGVADSHDDDDDNDGIPDRLDDDHARSKKAAGDSRHIHDKAAAAAAAKSKTV